MQTTKSVATAVAKTMVTVVLTVAVTLFTVQESMKLEFLTTGIDQKVQSGWACLEFQSWVIDGERQGLDSEQLYRQTDRALETAAVNEEIGEEVGDYFAPCGVQGQKEIRELIDQILADGPRH